jgi:hypothetical protein
MKTSERAARWHRLMKRNYIRDTINPILPKYIHGAGVGVTKCEFRRVNARPKALGITKVATAHSDECVVSKTLMDVCNDYAVICDCGRSSWNAGCFMAIPLRGAQYGKR